MPKPVDRTGRQYGFLTAIEPTQKTLSSGRKMPAWRLRCACGNEVVAMSVNLDKGKHTSCGCQRLAWVKERHPDPDTRKPEYRVYRQMIDRCYLFTAPNYRWYGARGIEVASRWTNGEGGKTGFQCFMEDMGPRPDGLTLERKNPLLNYGPDNCKWATWQEQATNKREHWLSPDELAKLKERRAASHPRKITPELREAILARLDAGEKQIPIALSLGLSQTTISKIKTEASAPLAVASEALRL